MLRCTNCIGKAHALSQMWKAVISICSLFYPFCDLCIDEHHSIVLSVSSHLVVRSLSFVLFQASEFEDITPGHMLCTLVLHGCHPIPEVGRKKCVGFLRWVEAIGFAEG